MSQPSLGAMVKDMLSNEVRSIYAVPVTDPRSGWTASALAFRRALADHFPTTVWEATAADAAVAWVVLNQKAVGWSVAASPQVPDEIWSALAQEPRIQFSHMEGSKGFWVHHVGSEPDLASLAFLFREDLQLLLDPWVTAYVAQWERRRMAAFQQIGYRPWTMAIPANPTPSPIVSIVARADPWPRPLTYDDILDTVNRCRSLTCVPEPVFAVLERCIRLFLWGYQEWDFFTVSEHYAGLAVDTSLRALWWTAQSYPATIEFQDGKGTVVESYVARDAEAVRIGYRPSGSRSVLVNGRKVPGQKNHVLAWAYRNEWVSPEETRQIRYLFAVRDWMSHPDHQYRQWFGHVDATVQWAASAINGMWARFTAPHIVPWEGDFGAQPRWFSGNG